MLLTILSSFIFIVILGIYTPAQNLGINLVKSINEAILLFTGTEKGHQLSNEQFSEINQYSQGFEIDNVWGDPGTDPTRVASGNNGIVSKTGGFHAEAIAGNFTRWGGYNSVFPTSGYTTSVDIYLNVVGGYGNDTRFDFTSAISQPDGNHRRDFVFNGGFYSDAVAPGNGNRFVIGASNNSGQPPKNAGGDPFVVTSTGWYTFKHRFYNNGSGVLAVQMSLIDAGGTVLKTWVRSNATDIIGTTVGGNRYGWFPIMGFPNLAIDNSARANILQDAPVKVEPGNLNNWSAVSQRTASASFVKGPLTAPMGYGSHRMATGAGNSGPDLPQGGAGTGGKSWFTTQQFNGTLLSNITALSYSTFVTSATSPSVAPTIQLQVDIDGNGSRDAALVFEPVYSVSTQGPITTGAWQNWNARTGKWWFTNNSITTGQFCPSNCFNYFSDIVAAFPNAKIVQFFPGFVDGQGFQIVSGQNSAGAPWSNFDGNVDALTIGVSGNNTTFDFEPTLTTVVDDDGMATAGDCNATIPASNNIEDAVTVAVSGDTIRVCPGTYPLSSTVNINKQNLTILGIGAKPKIQIAQAVGSAFFVTADGVTLDNLEIEKTDIAGEHNLIRVQANNFTAQNNLIYGPYPGGTWNSTGIVSRGFVISANSNITIQNNVIHDLRQPAYMSGNPLTGGTISGNNVSGTKGWVVEGGAFNFTGNTFGEPQNQDCDIALLSSINPANYTPILGLSTGNDNAFICAQYSPGTENGRAIAYVDDNAGPGGNGSDNANYQSITSAIAGTLTGGTVQVAPGGYNEDVVVSKSVKVLGAGVATTTVSGPIGGGGATFSIQASNVELSGFKITRAGNNVTDWNNSGLNSGGITVQGQAITGLNLHDNLITGNRSAIDINNSNGHSIHNNVITDNHTGLIFRNQTDNITLIENEVKNNRTVGVLFLDASSGSNSPVQTAANGNFSNNNISGNWYGQIVDRQSGGSLPTPGTTNLKNFGGNWYGTSSPIFTMANSAEPGYASLIPVAYGGTATPPGGQPDIAGTASGNFDFSPYLDSGLDTNVQTTPLRGTYGFQGSFNALNVTAASPQTNGGLSNIQEGINMITAGGMLNILSGTYAGNVDINKALTLRGTPTIDGTLTASVSNARISPGFSPGTINSGDLTLSAGSFVDIELNGTTAGTGYDQINVNGSVNLNGATLNLTTGFTPTAGNSFTIINNDGSDAVTGIFSHLPEGEVFFIGSNSFRISYIGGTGNDVVLTSVSLCNTVSIPTAIPAQPVSSVNVPVNVDDVTGKGLLSFDFTLNYNPAVINTPTVSLTPLTSGRSLTYNSSTPGVLIVSVFGQDPLAGAGALVNISFNAVGSIGSSSGLNFSSFVFNEGTPCLSTSNGSVNIISGTVSGIVSYAHTPFVVVPGTNLNGSGAVNVSAQTDLTGAYTLSGFGAGAYTVTPAKTGDLNSAVSSNDSARIAQHVAGILPLNTAQLIVADVSGNGTITSFDAALIARFVVNLPNTGNTGTWQFSPANRGYASVSANLSGENYTAYLMGDVTGNWISGITMFAPLVEEIREKDRVRVTVPRISANADSLVTIPLDVSDTTEKGIVSYQFDLIYDPNLIEPQETLAEKVGTLSDGMIVTYNSVAKDRVRVAVFGALPLESKGTLLNLKFKVIGSENSSSPLRIENFVFNENTQLALTFDGEIQISGSTDDKNFIEGQLITSAGKSVSDTEVILTDTMGGSIIVYSNKEGYFQFKGLAFGETYAIRVNSKNYIFAQQTISITEGITKLNLIAEQ